MFSTFCKTHTASWITNKIKNAIVRDCLFKQWMGNPDEANRMLYKVS